MGRPTKMTDETVGKLEQGFKYGFNITEACSYAEISRLTYYRWIDKGTQFRNRMNRAQTALQRKAKTNLAEAINSGDIETSKYYLERKCGEDFS